jgi:hypothetical protein
MYRREVVDGRIGRKLERWANRLAKIAGELKRLDGAK